MRLSIFLLLFLWAQPGLLRIHHLTIHNDRRRYIPLSTFGFYTGGKLQVNMTGFHLGDIKDYDSLESIVGFSIDKTVSDALNPYVQEKETQCILGKTLKDTDKAGMVRFILNFKDKVTNVKCSKNVRSITILDSPNKDAESIGALSDAGLFKSAGGRRQKRSMNEPDPDGFFGTPLDKEIEDYNKKAEQYSTDNSNNSNSSASSDKPNLKSENKTVEHNPDKEESNVSNIEGSDVNVPNSKEKTPPMNDGIIKPEPITSTHQPVDSCEDNKIPLKIDENGYFQTSFVIYINDAKLEGLYSMFFHNCFNYRNQPGGKQSADFTILIEEKNNDNYLSAGEMPLPALYELLSILFFLSGCFWVFILKKNGSEQVFRIHWIMASLVFLKSLSLFFHGVNYNKIAANGKHVESWAILYYITHLLKGGLLFFTIVLIGSGWAFVKHVLSSNEKKVFMVVLPLQVISNVAYIVLEESEQGEATHNFWKEMFVLIDLICCGAILLPVVWSIKHLQDAQHTDGKAAVSLEKLKLFRHFYVMVVCYVYFTRIIVYLLRITVPFQYEWLDSMFKEVATLVFFVLTGYKFRPASNNPYFALATDDDSEEVLIGGNQMLEQATTRKSYKINDYEDEEETIVLFSKTDEISHDLD